MMSGDYHSQESDAFLESLRKDLVHHVAHKLTYDINDPAQVAEIKPELTAIINKYLTSEGIALKDEIRLELIEELYGRLTRHAPTPVVQKPSEDLRISIASHLAQFLSDEIAGVELSREIARLIDVKCKQDGHQLAEMTRAELISEMCGRMNVPPPPEVAAVLEAGAPALPDTPPDALPPFLPEEEPPALVEGDLDPGAPVDPNLSYEALMSEVAGAQGAPESAAEWQDPAPLQNPVPRLRARGGDAAPAAKPADPSGASLPLRALTHEIKRELLYHLSQTMDVTILGMSDESHARAHVSDLIAEYCREHRLGLTETEVERVIDEILRGEGLEFQL